MKTRIPSIFRMWDLGLNAKNPYKSQIQAFRGKIGQNYLLVFYSQLLTRVPVVLCLGARGRTPPSKF